MKILSPSYYPLFSCIAGKCRHSCCIGWEIGIDEESYERFRLIDGGSGKVLDKIHFSNGTHQFKTDENGRCAFLNKDGLCDLILNYGEAVLCPICADHPRFRSFFSSFTEIGLGLSCEAAAKIILENKDPFTLLPLPGDGQEISLTEDERELLSVRNELIGLLEDQSAPIESRIRALFDACEADADALSFDEVTEFLLSLERLDKDWGDLLSDLKGVSRAQIPDDLSLPLQNMCIYFVYRHMPLALDKGDLLSAMLLCAFLCYLSLELVSRFLMKHGSVSSEDMISIARLLSGELEYSDENLYLIMDKMLDIFE